MSLALMIAQAVQPLQETAQTVAEKVNETNLTENTAVKTLSIFDSVLHSDPLVKLTLLLLLGFSVLCWTVIFLKFKQLKNSSQATQSFWQKFSTLGTLTEASQLLSAKSGPLHEIFVSGLETVNRIKKTNKPFSPYARNMLEQKLVQAKEEEVYKLEQYVSFLATTAAVAPFIGLFGTVWGILTAFMAIGQAGSSSLATVGPFIAEALVATAVGLFAAIPAVIFYNYFVGQIRLIQKVIDIFMDDFLLKSELEF